MNRITRTLFCAFAALPHLHCGATDPDTAIPARTTEAIKTYSEIAVATYEDALGTARAVAKATSALTQSPSSATLEAAKTAWRVSREPYLQSEVFRFYDGPIDAAEGQLNAWPLDEAYIDYVAQKMDAGIINDPSIPIDSATMQSMNEQGGEENISTGYHAVEFLLWGQDLNEDGPGNRPFTDYAQDETRTAEHQVRRGAYLTTASALIAAQLEEVVTEWKDGAANNYRARFENVEPREALRRILTGMVVLSGFETGGERLQAALDSGNQEDEHSCFSDNTHRDMIGDIQGILNVWNGTYTRLDKNVIRGVGIRDVVRDLDVQLAAQVDDQINESLRLANQLIPPFDREIAESNEEGRSRVRALIASLRTQAKLLEKVMIRFKLSVPAEE